VESKAEMLFFGFEPLTSITRQGSNLASTFQLHSSSYTCLFETCRKLVLCYWRNLLLQELGIDLLFLLLIGQCGSWTKTQPVVLMFYNCSFLIFGIPSYLFYQIEPHFIWIFLVVLFLLQLGGFGREADSSHSKGGKI